MRDLGGIGPKDEVNPDYPHPHYQRLAKILAPAGWQLVPRLPVYPRYYNWLPERLQSAVLSMDTKGGSMIMAKYRADIIAYFRNFYVKDLNKIL